MLPVGQVGRYLETVAAEVAKAENPQLLDRLIKQWSAHKMSMGMIRDILMYMVHLSAHDWLVVPNLKDVVSGSHLCAQGET